MTAVLAEVILIPVAAEVARAEEGAQKLRVASMEEVVVAVQGVTLATAELV